MKYNSWGTEYELEFCKGKYQTNNTLAIQILETEEGKDFSIPFCMLTVNLETSMNPPINHAYIDVNNCPREIIAQLESEGKIMPTGIFEPSGFVVYLLYEFSQEFLNEMQDI